MATAIAGGVILATGFHEADGIASLFVAAIMLRAAFGLLRDSGRIFLEAAPAGLDPEERNRFHNLLSEIGEDAVIVLSTHIVEDVSDLCPKIAILAGGRILLEGSPARLIEQLNGRLWRKTVAKSAVGDYRTRHAVISTRLFGGETQLHVLADARPEAGFELAAPSLEDVYFATLAERPAC